MLETYELLDRFEILYSEVTELSDLRRAYNDEDLSSIFRLVTNDNKENIRKLVMEDNTWSLWKLLAEYKDTQFISAFKNFFINNVEYDNDCFSRGQLQSKLWLVSELQKLDVDLGTVFLCAGWYSTLATMLFESGMNITKIRSFDIDPNVWKIAEIFNKPWVTKDWQFKASTKDILDIDFVNDNYVTERSNGTTVELNDTPDTIINTSCEHIENFAEWYDKIPDGKLVVLQSNNFYEVEEHVNCVGSVEEFVANAPMQNILYSGELDLPKYRRFMLIGRK